MLAGRGDGGKPRVYIAVAVRTGHDVQALGWRLNSEVALERLELPTRGLGKHGEPPLSLAPGCPSSSSRVVSLVVVGRRGGIYGTRMGTR